AFPELYDPIIELEQESNREPYFDWNEIWITVQFIFKNNESAGWAIGAKVAKQKHFFRSCFTVVDPDAAPVIATTGAKGLISVADFPSYAQADLDRVFGVFKRSPLAPLKKGGKESQVPLSKGDLGGSSVTYEPDPNLRDNENVPLKEDIVSFFLREVRPYVGDAWINSDRKWCDELDGAIGKVGYEINFNREFFKYQAPRDLKVIDAELAEVENRILEMLKDVTK
ncbi:MAG: SAM-dependent DNA methyltransferase, partial [Pseudanabaena sp.]